MDEATRESVEVLLCARVHVYRVFQSLFGGHPTEELLKVLADESTVEALRFFASDSDDAFSAAEEAFAAELQEVTPEALDPVYVRLFVGTGKMVAPPWESVYLRPDRLLFTEETLAVREAYRAQGFIPKGYPVVADDSLALELDFMAELAKAACDGFANGGEGYGEALNRLEASAAFLDGHLMVWIGRYLDALHQGGEDGFYSKAAALVDAFLSCDREAIDELVAVLR